ncbi:MAG: transposase, partial [Bacteroidales bacterium]|nr:transposase [Bacteroidales bacterium]
NMPLLWTFFDYPEIHLPNTNNAIEALFTDLKTKIRVHNGLSKHNRMKFIDQYFYNKQKSRSHFDH